MFFDEIYKGSNVLVFGEDRAGETCVAAAFAVEIEAFSLTSFPQSILPFETRKTVWLGSCTRKATFWMCGPISRARVERSSSENRL